MADPQLKVNIIINDGTGRVKTNITASAVKAHLPERIPLI